MSEPRHDNYEDLIPDPPPPLDADDQSRFDTLNRAMSLAVPEGWLPVDIAPYWDGLADGTLELPAPTVGIRSDGAGLFYRHRVNGVFGRFGSAKSYVGLVAALGELARGETVVWIDLEDNPTGMTQRLIDLGAERSAVLAGFRYMNPIAGLGDDNRDAFLRWVASEEPSLVVADSAGEWLSLEGANQNYDDEVARWLKSHLTPMAAAGAAVVSIDHIPHDARDPLRAIGSQRKMSGISGVTYLVEMVREMGRGKSGMSKLTSAKDRLGFYPRSTVVADLTIDATSTPYTVALAAPDPRDSEEGPLPDEPPAVRRVYAALSSQSEPVRTRQLGDVVADDGSGFGLKQRTIQESLSRLAELGLAERSGHAHSGYEWSIPDKTLEQAVAEGEAELGAEPLEDLPDPY